MEFMNQPLTGQLGERLIELLDSSDYHTLNIAVAFAKNSGVLRIKDSLSRFRERGGIVNVYVGVDLGGTSYEALNALLCCSNSLNVIHFENYKTFHPKIYQFIGDDNRLIIVGSHNLTGGGLWTNFESSVIISLEGMNSNEEQFVRDLDNYFNSLTQLSNSIMSINTKDDIETLLENGYTFKEIAERVRLAKTSPSGVSGSLFSHSISATLPPIATQDSETTQTISLNPATIPLSEEMDTIWFETRSLTGGSRNILDLSMRSLVECGNPTGTPFDIGEPGFMRGGVEFFGINPTDTDSSKNITINFEGVDYAGNKILFPRGELANGSWRLQIKGINASGTKITETFRAISEEDYLVRKIITFTKIEDDYYSITVFPESTLEEFKAASRILARNGSIRTAKWLGLL
ncbi:phospholipase D-like domain-containing protein [Edwardsiella piscicida]|uniref:phospholipase D-like domain-containing protein n=1 Tax=Edwardsiella piscicida TaxID=1263550 RepID=UPI00370DD00A